MDLTTTYLGFTLPHPFMPGSSPLADELDTVRRLEDAGAPAVVIRSLFEEQILSEDIFTQDTIHQTKWRTPEAESFYYDSVEFRIGPENYLDHVRKVREAVGVPVFASLNGVHLDRCVDYARQIEQAGAHGLELNLYSLATRFDADAREIEEHTVAMVKAIKGAIQIPVAVKLSPFWTAIANIAHRLDQEAGADGLVLFNRFYQPDIDVERLEVSRELHLSTSDELLLRLRWLAILHGRLDGSLAVTGGVHTPVDGIKAVMAGADAVQVVSALLLNGPGHLAVLRDGMARWMEEREYASLQQMRGSMSLGRVEDTGAYERANYIQILGSLRSVPL